LALRRSDTIPMSLEAVDAAFRPPAGKKRKTLAARQREPTNVLLLLTHQVPSCTTALPGSRFLDLHRILGPARAVGEAGLFADTYYRREREFRVTRLDEIAFVDGPAALGKRPVAGPSNGPDLTGPPRPAPRRVAAAPLSIERQPCRQISANLRTGLSRRIV
jgi:hypothetical protein